VRQQKGIAGLGVEAASSKKPEDGRTTTQKVEQFMSTDLFNVQEDEPIDLRRVHGLGEDPPRARRPEHARD
jgi:hypothetical protein